MRFSLRIFLGYFLIVVASGSYLFSLVGDEIKPTVRQTAEEVLVDTANLLAELIRDDFVAGALDRSRFESALARYADRQPGARIWDIRKNTVDLRVYVTDAAGVVRLDSAGRSVGQDFSRWRDVYLALRGQYGARTSEEDLGQGPTTVMHVAAPILDGARVVGVVTVAKPNYTMQPYIDRAYAKLLAGALGLVGAGLVLGAAFSWWLSRGIGRVIGFADAVAAGIPAAIPALPANRELRRLAEAVGRMRDRLEGKAYIEQFVQGLAHELKSPLSGIQASAELLAEPLDAADRQRFGAHIQGEAARLARIVERLLELARVEQRTIPARAEVVDLNEVLDAVVAALAPLARSRELSVAIGPRERALVRGDRFLIEQALRNLVQNALDFSPAGGKVELALERQGSDFVLSVSDSGPGVPAYAAERIFERFYSLPRPDGTVRGTGLGLPLTRAVARLHGGDAGVATRAAGGAVATLRLPGA